MFCLKSVLMYSIRNFLPPIFTLFLFKWLSSQIHVCGDSLGMPKWQLFLNVILVTFLTGRSRQWEWHWQCVKTDFFCDKNGRKLSFCISWNWNLSLFSFYSEDSVFCDILKTQGFSNLPSKPPVTIAVFYHPWEVLNSQSLTGRDLVGKHSFVCFLCDVCFHFSSVAVSSLSFTVAIDKFLLLLF